MVVCCISALSLLLLAASTSESMQGGVRILFLLFVLIFFPGKGIEVIVNRVRGQAAPADDMNSV